MKKVKEYQNNIIDDGTIGHSSRVSALCSVMGELAGMSRTSIDRLVQLAGIHDIGKIKIPSEILMKPGPLTDDEYIIVKNHVQYSADILAVFGFTESDIRPVLEHHERCDGSGYPKGLVADEISKEGKILGVMDVFEALYSKRPYKEPWSCTKIKEYFKENKTMCSEIVSVLLEHFDEFCEVLKEKDD